MDKSKCAVCDPSRAKHDKCAEKAQAWGIIPPHAPDQMSAQNTDLRNLRAFFMDSAFPNTQQPSTSRSLDARFRYLTTGTPTDKRGEYVNPNRRKTMSRRHVPCRVCGANHVNPRSSSLCPTCGEKEADENKVLRARAEDAARDAEQTKLRELDNAETVHDLREWIKEYLLD